MPDQTTGDREEGKGDTHLNGIKGTSILNYGSKSPEFPLRHFADQQISLDLYDRVKVNYGKFGNLLAEVKAVTGGEE